MPRYFINLYNDEILKDDTGQVFSDDVAAREAAVLGASELIAEHVAAGTIVDLRNRVEVQNEDRSLAMTIRFGDLFTGYNELSPQSR